MKGKWQPGRVAGGDKGTSLYKNISNLKNKFIDNRNLQTIRTPKEVPLSASMTLEASIALPLFIFFFVNIIAAIEIVRVQSEMEGVLHQVGNEVALLAYDLREGEDVLSSDDSLRGLETLSLNGYAYYKIKKELDEKLDNSPVVEDISVANMLSSKVLAGDDIIDIVIDYKVHPIISLIGFRSFMVESRYYGHAWTGYDISQGKNCEEVTEEIVYVTKHGSVYHRDIDCKYLHPSVRSVPYDQVSSLRNQDRSKYYACQDCGKGVTGGNVFITDYGERFHTKVDCPGIKRSIYSIPISEVGGKAPCSGCG